MWRLPPFLKFSGTSHKRWISRLLTRVQPFNFLHTLYLIWTQPLNHRSSGRHKWQDILLSQIYEVSEEGEDVKCDCVCVGGWVWGWVWAIVPFVGCHFLSLWDYTSVTLFKPIYCIFQTIFECFRNLNLIFPSFTTALYCFTIISIHCEINMYHK